MTAGGGAVSFAGVPGAAWAVQVAVVAALQAHAPLAALLATKPSGAPAVYDGLAPAGQPLNYLTVGDSPEARADTFGRPGHTVALTLHLWAQGPGRETAAALDAAVRGALVGRALAVEGHTPARGRIALLSSLVDPDGVTHHRVLRYTTTVRVLPA